MSAPLDQNREQLCGDIDVSPLTAMPDSYPVGENGEA
jgi:hypothetical protein